MKLCFCGDGAAIHCCAVINVLIYSCRNKRWSAALQESMEKLESQGVQQGSGINGQDPVSPRSYLHAACHTCDMPTCALLCNSLPRGCIETRPSDIYRHTYLVLKSGALCMPKPLLTTVCACLQLLLKRMDVLETELVMSRQEKSHLQNKLEDALMQLSHTQAQLHYARSIQVREGLTSNVLQAAGIPLQTRNRAADTRCGPLTSCLLLASTWLNSAASMGDLTGSWTPARVATPPRGRRMWPTSTTLRDGQAHCGSSHHHMI
jgi:hypothetical protein